MIDFVKRLRERRMRRAFINRTNLASKLTDYYLAVDQGKTTELMAWIKADNEIKQARKDGRLNKYYELTRRSR